ncbi:MAG: YggS family pyridoxal phosphate-dependent enzyme [Acidobacteriota bacterium]
MEADIRANLIVVQTRIAAAAARAGRDASEIKLVAVSKTHPPAAIRQAIEARANVFGENKVQEAESKIPEIGRVSAEWHLIGHLQSNKARKAVQLFDVIQSVDSIELATRLDRICDEEKREELSVFVEVDLAGEDSKSGIPEADLSPLIDFLKACKHLKFNGLMLLPPFFEDAEKTRPYFKRLRELRDKRVGENAFVNGSGELSMGMSHDFEIAIEEGSTVVRVGTAIFGEREKAAG